MVVTTIRIIEIAKIRQIDMDNLFVVGFEDRGMIINAARQLKKVEGFDVSKVVKENWDNNGSLSVDVTIPAGMMEDFVSDISSLTHGNADIKIK